MATDNPKISVIVPVYNVEKYLPRCIDSILAQTFTDFELLLIDDGSKDHSGEICDQYAKKDNRIRVFHKENEGISATREYGLNKTQGNYIQFVDSDDWIEKEMLQLMHDKANTTDADLVNCDFFQEYTSDSQYISTTKRNKNEFICSVIGNYWGVLWKLLIRRSLFNQHDIHFPIGINGGEDYYVVVSLLLVAPKIEQLPMALYHYRRNNENSFISTPTYEKLMYQVRATNLVEDKLKEYGKKSQYTDEIIKRKIASLLPLLRHYFLKSYKLYPELKCNSIKLVHGCKNRLLYMLFILLGNRK